MIKKINIERLGELAANTTDLPTRMVSFHVKNTTPIGFVGKNKSDTLADGSPASDPTEIINRFVKLDLPGGYAGGFVNSQITSSNALVKQNFDTYVKAIEACAAFYAEMLLQTRNKWIDLFIAKHGIPDSQEERNKIALSVDGLFHKQSNHFMADHLAELFLRDKPRRYDNSIHSLNRYINGSYDTMHQLLSLSNVSPQSGMQEMSFMENDDIAFERNCMHFLLGQSLLHSIVIANMNYTLGKPDMTYAFASNWTSSKKIMQEQISQYSASQLMHKNPDNTNPFVYFGRMVWANFTNNLFCNRSNELTACSEAFVSLVCNRVNHTLSDAEKRQHAQEALFNVYADSMQLAINLYNDHAFIDKVSTDMAECFVEIVVINAD